ncbi:MAG: CPBP family glutamic-type intramembrane protease [Candidatus Bathyarchaeia archaeon]
MFPATTDILTNFISFGFYADFAWNGEERFEHILARLEDVLDQVVNGWQEGRQRTGTGRGRKHKPREKTHVADIELFQALSLLFFFMYFGLNTVNIAAQFNRFVFYGMLLLGSLVSLNTTMIRHGLPMPGKNVPDWDENFEWWHLGIIMASVSAIYALNTLFLGPLSTAFPEPMSGTLAPIAFALIPQVWANLIQQILWQTFVVAFAEETLKIAVILPFSRRWQLEFIMAPVVIGIWAEGHSVLAYGGAFWPLVAAFAGGIIIYAIIRITRNLLTGVIAHAGINLISLVPMMSNLLPTVRVATAGVLISYLSPLLVSP